MTPWQTRLDAVLRSWQGTPFGAGQCCRGRCVDCRYFVCAVLDALYGVSLPLPPRLPLQTSIHNRTAACAAFRELTARYPCQVLHGEPEPGDVIIVRPAMAHAETLKHAMIVGINDQLWHAGMGGVRFTSIDRWQITSGFRTLEKQRWVLN